MLRLPRFFSSGNTAHVGPRYVNAVTDSPVLMDGWGVFSRGGTLFQKI